MLKLSTITLQAGTQITLTERWHEMLETFSKISNLPYQFVLVNTIKADKEKYFIFESDNQIGKKKCRIALDEFVVKYIFSEEVPDSNIGFYFKEYLPIEGTPILLTSTRNPNELLPCILNVEAELICIDGEDIITLKLQLNYMNGTGFANIRFFAEGSKKCTWKFLLHEDESYMTDYEKMFRDTIIHKGFVKKSAEKLIRYLEKEKAFEHADLLRQRALIHDNSKLSCTDELHALSRIINDKTTLRDASKQLSPIKKDAIALHWKHNSHHPEHFNSPMDMQRVDIMEMCCDWHARSTQYKTDFLSYVQKQQAERFHFPEWMFAEIMHYCRVLDSEF